jgi:adenylyltransferase/sulfurtransferase
MTAELARDRYYKQTLLREIGPEGQEKLKNSSVVIAGCGALGTSAANNMVRAGVGKVTIIDRDYIEYDNLPRQILFDEDDIKKGLPKAVAAAEKLQKINSSAEIVPVVADLTSANIEKLVAGADLIMDGTDNFETRFLINEVSDKLRIPWIYAGVVSTYGMVFPVIPGTTPCLNCFITDIPSPGSTPTCDTAGVLGAAVTFITSIETAEALKILTGDSASVSRALIYADVWEGTYQKFNVTSRGIDCPVCGNHRYDFLEKGRGSKTVTLCGQNSVQVSPDSEGRIDFNELAGRLEGSGEVRYNNYMMNFKTGDFELNIFPEGRVIIKNISDPVAAKTLYSKYIGL